MSNSRMEKKEDRTGEQKDRSINLTQSEHFKYSSQSSPGEGNGNPLQYSYLENPTDRGGWWATAHGVAKSRTRLSVHAASDPVLH